MAGGSCGLLVLGAQRLVLVEAGCVSSRRDSDLHTLGVDAGQVDCVIRATVNNVSSGRGKRRAVNGGVLLGAARRRPCMAL